jgi:hypothetical protein
VIKPLEIRRKLGRKDWNIPEEWAEGWRFENKHEVGRVLVTYWWEGDHYSEEWIHASIAFKERMPTYEEMKLMHEAVFPKGYAYQVFVPSDKHVTFHEYALHLWGRTDGVPVLPEFSQPLKGLGRMV